MIKDAENFKIRWKNRIDEIKEQSFDNAQCYNINIDFIKESVYIASENSGLTITDLEIMNNDLKFALEIAQSNFRKEKKGFWAKIFGGKKELSLMKI